MGINETIQYQLFCFDLFFSFAATRYNEYLRRRDEFLAL